MSLPVVLQGEMIPLMNTRPLGEGVERRIWKEIKDIWMRFRLNASYNAVRDIPLRDLIELDFEISGKHRGSTKRERLLALQNLIEKELSQ